MTDRILLTKKITQYIGANFSDAIKQYLSILLVTSYKCYVYVLCIFIKGVILSFLDKNKFKKVRVL